MVDDFSESADFVRHGMRSCLGLVLHQHIHLQFSVQVTLGDDECSQGAELVVHDVGGHPHPAGGEHCELLLVLECEHLRYRILLV